MSYYDLKKDQKKAQFNKIFPLADYFEPFIGDKKVVHIADLGSGPVSTTGSIFPDVVVHLYPSDSKVYNYGELLIPIQQQDMEALTYPDNFFDIVHCVNALDHTKDPHKAVEEMKRVCKKGGWVYLRHASSQKNLFGGHHYHNIEGLDFVGFHREEDKETRHRWITHTYQK